MRRLGRAPAWVRWAGGAVAVVVALNLLVLALDHYSHVPSGPASSSFSTGPEGAAAYSSLLARSGHRVRRLTDDAALGRLAPSSTLVVLGAGYLGRTQVEALRRFVDAGGRVVVGVTGPEPWVGRFMSSAPRWTPAPVARPSEVVPSAVTQGVDRVVTAGEGSWTPTGGAVGLVGWGRRWVVASAVAGSGRIELVADVSFLQNRLLGAADNAALALDLAGPPGRAVAFLETVHGYGSALGYGAVPLQWKLALAGVAAAALLWLIATGRRVGAPEAADEEAAPERTLYVDSLAVALARARDPAGAFEPVVAELRAVVARRARLAEDASREQIAAAAAELRCDEAAVRVLREGIGEPGDGVAAGRALVGLTRGEA